MSTISGVKGSVEPRERPPELVIELAGEMAQGFASGMAIIEVSVAFTYSASAKGWRDEDGSNTERSWGEAAGRLYDGRTFTAEGPVCCARDGLRLTMRARKFRVQPVEGSEPE